MKSVSAHNRTVPPCSAESFVKTRRCCGRIPSGLPADLRGKEQMAPVTSSSNVTRTGENSPDKDGNRACDSGCGPAQIASSEHSTLTAPPVIIL